METTVRKTYEKDDFNDIVSEVELTGRCKTDTIILNDGVKFVNNYIEVYRKLFGFKVGRRWVNSNYITTRTEITKIYDCE